jgi:hypothetical protein
LGLFEATVTHRIEIPQLESILAALGSPGGEWQKSIEAILMSVKVDLNKLRRGLDKFHANETERKRLLEERREYLASEEIEDRDAAVYVAQAEEYKALSEAEKASLRARIAELEALGDGMSEAERERLNGMIEELAQAVALESEAPSEEVPADPVAVDPPTDEAPADESGGEDTAPADPAPVHTPAPSPL